MHLVVCCVFIAVIHEFYDRHTHTRTYTHTLTRVRRESILIYTTRKNVRFEGEKTYNIVYVLIVVLCVFVYLTSVDIRLCSIFAFSYRRLVYIALFLSDIWI